MAKKYKTNCNQPNAPDLQTVLLESPSGQQHPHNPYYPDPYLASPPPYTDLSTGTTRMTTPTYNNANYQRFNNAVPTVIVQRTVAAPRHQSVYGEKVKKFVRQIIVLSILKIFVSYISINLYASRSCVDDFVIHQPGPSTFITVGVLKDATRTLIGLSVVFLVVSLLKAMIGYRKSSGCFLFIIGILSFLGMMFTGYMVYLSFYSPCVASLDEIVSKSAKTAFSHIASIFKETAPNPEKGIFREKNVFNYINEDPNGLFIFLINVWFCTIYLSYFFTSISLC